MPIDGELGIVPNSLLVVRPTGAIVGSLLQSV